MTFLRRPCTRQLTARRLGSDLGATAVEYALLVAGVALVMIVGVAFVGASIGGGVATAAEALSTGAGPVVVDGEAPEADAEQAPAEQAEAAVAQEQAAVQEQEAAEQAEAARVAAEEETRLATERAAGDKAAAMKDCAKNKNFSWNHGTGMCEKLVGSDKDSKDDKNDDDDDDDDDDDKRKNR